MLSLDIAICTLGKAGIARVASMNLPQLPGVRYVVSWQGHDGIEVPEALYSRSDIALHRYNERGLSRNRNNAFEHCTADIVLIADDDLIFHVPGLDELRRVFEENPKIDFATFRSERPDMKHFPSESVALGKRLPKNYHVTSFEIALRRATTGSLRFCAEFGLGAEKYHGGEEELLLQSAVRRGMHCRFFPITICSHPHESTGTKARMTDGNLRAFGAVIALTYPWTTALRLPLKAWRLCRRRQASFFHALSLMSAAAIAVPALLRRNRNTLW